MTQRDYEIVARHLDGEAVELTDEQRALAERVREDEALLGAALDVPAPAGRSGRGWQAAADLLAVPAGRQGEAEQALRAERRLGRLLDVAVPPAAHRRLERRLRAALARPGVRWRRVGVAAAASVAAAIVLAAALTRGPAPQAGPSTVRTAGGGLAGPAALGYKLPAPTAEPVDGPLARRDPTLARLDRELARLGGAIRTDLRGEAALPWAEAGGPR
jgi:hypothetical protein